MQPYMKPIFVILLTRLNNSKTEILTQRFVRLFYLLSGKDTIGPDVVMQAIEEVQAGIFAQVYTSVIIPETSKLSRPIDRKIAAVGLVGVVGFSELMATTYHKGWANTTNELLKVVDLEPTPVQGDSTSDLQGADIDEVSFGAAFARLNTCKKRADDPFPEATDLRRFVGERLKEANAKFGGRIEAWVTNELNDNLKATVQKYMQI